MPHSRAESLIDDCRRIADSLSPRQPELEAMLAGYLLVVLVADYETRIHWLFTSRAARRNDPKSENFVMESVERTVRSLKTGELAGALGRFGPECADKFRELLRDKKESETRYNNIIENRNLLAHGDSINMTLDEVIDSHPSSKTVIEAISQALSA